MKFQQLKTLLWRNLILKKRRPFSTLLEIAIPTLIILIISFFSMDFTYKDEVRDFENENINEIETLMENYYDHMVYGFKFPSEFDNQKQQILINNFKSNKYISKLKYIENNQNFTDFYSQNYIPEEVPVEVDGQQNVVDGEDYNNGMANTEYTVIPEYKIKIYKNEEEIEVDRKKSYQLHYDFFVFEFSSLTKYSLRYIDSEEKQLNERIKNIDFISYNTRPTYPYQAIINKSIIKMLKPDSQDITISEKILDKKGYSIDRKVNIAQEIAPLFMLFYFVPCICNLLVILVIEKETKIKESLVIIGLKKSFFWLSWAIVYGIIVLFSSIFVTVAMIYTKIFVYVDWSILILTITIFGLSCCALSFIYSILVKKSKVATIIGVMNIIVFFALYIFSGQIENNPTLYYICLFALSPISFISLLEKLINYDEQLISINMIKVFSEPSLRICFLGLVFTFILYLILAIYLDNVVPQGNNFHRKWHFFITDLFKSNKKKSSVNEDSGKNIKNNPYIQEDPVNRNKAVEIKNIGKTFKVKGENMEILKSIDFNGYYNEIFAILGHNGAGKTTLMNIMTGILSPTHGEVYYDGTPITGNETEISKQFGYCPQFDTFNNSLTVGEHVRLFAGIKGVKCDVDEVLKDIDLLNKKKSYPKKLSGGQKRKLCISLALLGSPKYVFLDEPTTGLDPYSRKNIWELLLRKKEGCIIFVTTHYMDEADLLADRKMIISQGNISCLGTSLFLKQQFNMNYSLDVHCKDPNDCAIPDQMIDHFCPGTSNTKTISNTNMQSTGEEGSYLITYTLPMKYSKEFKNIFENLNTMINDTCNSIENFSLTAPTLEELFIKLEKSDESNLQCQEATSTASVNMVSDSKTLVEKLDPVFGKTTLSKPSDIQQIFAIVKLRLKIFIRNKTFAFIYTLLPIFLSVLCIFLVNSSVKQYFEVRKYKPLSMSPSLYDNEKWFKEANVTGLASDIINRIGSANKINVNSISYNDEIAISSGKDTSKLNYVGGFYGSIINETLNFVIYNNDTDTYAIPVGVNLLSNAILEQYNIKDRISTDLYPFEYRRDDYSYSFGEGKEDLFNTDYEDMKANYEHLLIAGISLCISLLISVFGPYTVKEREDGITHQLFLNGTKRINYWLGVLISDFICIFVPIVIIAFAGYLNGVSIFNPKIIGFTLIMSIVWIFGCLLHQYVISYYFKKYDRIQTILVIINPIISLIVGIGVMVIATTNNLVIMEDIDQVTDEKERENLMNTKRKVLKLTVGLILFAPGLIIIIYGKIASYFVLKTYNNVDYNEIQNFLGTSKAKSILADTTLTLREQSDLLKKEFIKLKMPTISDLFKCHDKFIILVLVVVSTVIIYGVLLYIIERVKQKHLLKSKSYTPEERAKRDEKIMNGPVDVRNEYNRVQQSIDNDQANSNMVLRVFQITKDFVMKANDIKKRKEEERKKEMEMNGLSEEEEAMSKKEKKKMKKNAFEIMDNRMTYDPKKKKFINRIVDDVTFGVNTSECLGLLGPNGAGKTTTISMITGLLSYNHGVVKYGQKDLSETKICDLSLGYCSQHNSLWSLLTVKETIEFYLNICGYPTKNIPNYTKALIEACGIENHTHKKVSEISGGTKRKLSLIIAICSSPSYLILDEPSAGMDPFTRRYMWKLISELKMVRETATILTTHSTEEAEALCDRIAILIKGHLVCIDTPRSIKMNHSNTYTLEVFTSNPETFEESIVRQNNLFGLTDNDESYEVENSMNYQKYTVKMRTENIAKVFAIMESAQETGLVSQYNFGQYSLEQVFINFVNNAE